MGVYCWFTLWMVCLRWCWFSGCLSCSSVADWLLVVCGLIWFGFGGLVVVSIWLWVVYGCWLV